MFEWQLRTVKVLVLGVIQLSILSLMYYLYLVLWQKWLEVGLNNKNSSTVNLGRPVLRLTSQLIYYSFSLFLSKSSSSSVKSEINNLTFSLGEILSNNI